MRGAGPARTILSKAVGGLKPALPALVVAVIALVQFGRGIEPHVDELAWIGSSYYFDLVRRGDFQHPDWKLMPARESPQVGKYAFGIALRLAGRPIESIGPLAIWYHGYREVPGAWGTGRAFAERRAVADRLQQAHIEALERGPPRPIGPPEFLVTRLVAVFFGMVTASTIYAIGRAAYGPMSGLIAGALFALHPVSIEAETHALFDIIAVAFSALAVLGLIALVSPSRHRARSYALGAATGLAIALAVGTKMNALIIVLVGLAMLLIELGRAVAGPRVGGVSPILFALMVSAPVFFALNPVLFTDPIGGTIDLFAMPARTVEVQKAFLPDYLPSLVSRATAVGWLLCGGTPALVALAALTVLPTVSAIRCLGPRLVIALWWWIALAAVTVWVPFPWERYALPLVPPAALMAALALVDVTSLGSRFIARRRQAS